MTPRTPSLVWLLVISISALTACETSSPTVPDVGPTPAGSAAALIQALERRGATVRHEETMPASSFPFFSVRSQRLLVNGESVHVFEYPNSPDAAADRARVSPNGATVGNAHVDWIAPPQFYSKDRLIVLYVGRRDEVIGLLESILGPPFAGVVRT